MRLNQTDQTILWDSFRNIMEYFITENPLINDTISNGVHAIVRILRKSDFLNSRISEYDKIQRIRTKIIDDINKALPFRIPFSYYKEEVFIENTKGRTWIEYTFYLDSHQHPGSSKTYDWYGLTEIDENIPYEKWEEMSKSTNIILKNFKRWIETGHDEILEIEHRCIDDNAQYFDYILELQKKSIANSKAPIKFEDAFGKEVTLFAIAEMEHSTVGKIIWRMFYDEAGDRSIDYEIQNKIFKDPDPVISNAIKISIGYDDFTRNIIEWKNSGTMSELLKSKIVKAWPEVENNLKEKNKKKNCWFLNIFSNG
jgi:hypothetical protein